MNILQKQLRRLDSFINTMTGLNTGGDKGAAGTIAPVQHHEDTALENLHRQNAYAGVIVDELAHEATRKGWSIQTDDEKDIAQAFDDDWDTVGLVMWAAIMARLLGGSVILLVIDDGLDPSEPFNPNRPYTLLNMVVLDRREVFAQTFNTDITSRQFAEPELWTVQPQVNGTVSGMDSNRLVHNSRIVYFDGQKVSRRVRLANRGFGDPVLLRAFSSIRNKTSIDQSRASIIQDFKVDVIKTKNLDSIGTSDAQLDYFDSRMEIIARGKSVNNLVLLDEGEEFIKSTTTVAGLADLDNAATDELTTAARMPRTRFTGESPGGFNTDGDSQANIWNSQVASYQTNNLRRPLTKLYSIVLGAKNGPTNGKVPSTWKIDYAPLDEPTENQIASLRKTVAETDVLYLDRGVVDPQQIQEGRFGLEGWKLDLPSLEIEADVQTDPANSGGVDVQKTAMNGAQIASMLQVVQLVNEGSITSSQAAQVVSRAFQMTEAEAQKLINRADSLDGLPLLSRIDALEEWMSK